MASSSLSRRSLLAALVAACGQFAGCRQQYRIARHTWIREPAEECELVAIPTIVLPTLGEGPWDLRRDFQRALAAQLRKAKRMKLVEADMFPVVAACACAPSTTTWDEQMGNLGTVPAMQAVVSKVTYLQPTAPVKLGLVVELRDIVSRTTLRQVEGLWDAPRCHPTPPTKWKVKRVAEPSGHRDLHRISPRHLLEQAAFEIARDLQWVDSVEAAAGQCSECTG